MVYLLQEATLKEAPLDGGDRQILLPKAKIQVPRSQPNQMERPQLVPRIASAMREKKVVLVCAPAGFSKTVSLAKAAAEFPDNELFWISADEGDNLPRILSALFAALEPIDVPWRISRKALTGLATESEAGPRYVADAFAQAFEATNIAHSTIVFDDFHRIKDKAVFIWLDHLIERLPENWTLVLASRQTPAISLTRLRFLRQIAEFGSDELKFNLSEFLSLAVARGEPAYAEDMAKAWERVSGWPAACELVLQAGVSKSASSATGSALFELLSNDVLTHLSVELQDFLVRCSILPELTEDLCRSVTGDEKTLKHLREIRSRGLFAIELGEEPPVLKLHDLFRDFLKTRLREEKGHEQVRELYRRAAEAENNPERRLGFLLEAGNPEVAEKEFLKAATPLLLEGDLRRITGMVGMFPAEYAENSAEIAFVSGLCCDHQFSTAQQLLNRAASLYAAAGETRKFKRARALEVLAHFGPSVPQDALSQLEELKQDSDIGTEALCAFAQYLLARVTGTVEAELQHFDRMLELLVRSNDPVVWNTCAMHIYLGLQRGMVTRAERYATATLAIASDRHDTLRDSALSMRAWHYVLTGKYKKALDLISEIESAQNWSGRPYAARGGVWIARSLVIFFCGTPNELLQNAENFLEIFDGREGMVWIYWRGLTHVFFGKLFAAQGDWASVERSIKGLEAELRLLDAPYLRLGHAYLDLLLRLNGKGDGITDQLVETIESRPLVGDYLALEPALDAARALAYARNHRYADAWSVIAPMVDELSASDETVHLMLLGVKALRSLAGIPFAGGNHDAQRNQLLALAVKLEEIRKAALETTQRGLEGLTQREIEVLTCVAEGESNKSIARRYDLSPHTVKRHVANILEKLQVASRGQAAAWYRTNM